MVIQNSKVGMYATYQYSNKALSSVAYTSWGNVINQVQDQSVSTLPSATDSAQDKSDKTKEENQSEKVFQLVQGSKGIQKIIMDLKSEPSYEGIDRLEHDSLKNLFELLFLEGDTKKVSAQEMFERLLASYRMKVDKILENLKDYRFEGYGISNQIPSVKEVWGQEVVLEDFYQESEQTCFSSTGTVRTLDGREIEFNVQATMSRSFLSYSKASINYVSASLVDPLIINLTNDTAKVSDQKFLFDIDADGTKDNISLLASHCAFLALDKNNDGKINDGSELFGTKTADGFGELAVFDMDNNGWIDENDEIFNHLRIWHKDENGNDELIALGIAGIGAIYLGNRETRFSLNNKTTNGTNGMVQETGIFLREDGTAGTIQHVDFAKESA